MSVAMRIEVERKIVRAFVTSALDAGYRLSVSLERGFDVDEMLLGSTNRSEIINEAFAGDECHIFVHAPTGDLVEDGEINSIGWVQFVYGNEGWDVLSNYTTNLDKLGILKDAEKIADRYSR